MFVTKLSFTCLTYKWIGRRVSKGAITLFIDANSTDARLPWETSNFRSIQITSAWTNEERSSCNSARVALNSTLGTIKFDPCFDLEFDCFILLTTPAPFVLLCFDNSSPETFPSSTEFWGSLTAFIEYSARANSANLKRIKHCSNFHSSGSSSGANFTDLRIFSTSSRFIRLLSKLNSSWRTRVSKLKCLNVEAGSLSERLRSVSVSGCNTFLQRDSLLQIHLRLALHSIACDLWRASGSNLSKYKGNFWNL